MSEWVWDALVGTSLDEVRWRAGVVEELVGAEPVVVGGARRFGWNDQGGQSAVWYFADDGRVLLLTFDHEAELNLFAQEDFGPQEAFYRGVPEALVALVRDRPENYESLNLKDPATGRTIHYAGGVFWYDGTAWHVADGVAEYCRREGVDLFGESGFDYCLRDYRFGQDLTPESVVAARDEGGWYAAEGEREADLAAVREVFGRHRAGRRGRAV
ncbi:hypothetical protein [Streptomyces sp. NPDC047014]|uniref:hypothetical protein n=1 Tax=Streptomyces sp. NPDC047014 TaxID=3155736 RepID=UPI0033E9186B